jgi:DNA sulfur modification protein DndB
MGVAESTEQLNIPQYTILGKQALTMTLLEGTEGVGLTYLTKLTYQQCADNFDLEDESIPERERLQRDADKTRVEAIFAYLTTRDNTIFPSACLIITELELSVLLAGDLKVMKGILPMSSDRLFIDGQGRLGGIKKTLFVRPELANHYLDVKVIVVPTKTVRESAEFVCQIFSDYHLGLKKPNASQNIYFDNEEPLSRLSKEVLDMCQAMDLPFNDAISVNGKIKHGQLYNLVAVTDFIRIMVGAGNKKDTNAFLADQTQYDLYLTLILQYIAGVYQHLPLGDIQAIEDEKQWKAAITGNVLTCAIGLKALAFVGRSLIDGMIANEQSALETETIAKVAELPLTERGHKEWVSKQIYQIIEGKLTIVKSSEKRLASLLCYHMRILPCKDLA